MAQAAFYAFFIFWEVCFYIHLVIEVFLVEVSVLVPLFGVSFSLLVVKFVPSYFWSAFALLEVFLCLLESLLTLLEASY